MWKTFARTTACLALSATAFIAIARLNANAAARPKTATPETEPADSKIAGGSTRKKSPSKPTPAPAPAPKITTSSLGKTAPVPATIAPAAVLPAATTGAGRDDAATPAVPNWKGKRLSVARREARKLGLNVTAVDESGEDVPADMASSYRVRRQIATIGNAVELVVREIADAAEGY